MQILTAIGDAGWIVGLSFMASASLNAWKRIPKDAKVPMHFDNAGKPTRRASKPMALLFFPGIALAMAVFLRASAHRTQGVQGEVIATLLSVALPAVIAAIHVWHLNKSLQVLEDEGVVKR